MLFICLFNSSKIPVEIFFFRDLKRDVAKKLEKLEKRTQKAIVELIRECRYSFNINFFQFTL